MVNVGIIGFGFIGHMHLATLRKGGLAEAVAVADKEPANLSRDGGASGNIAIQGDAGLEGVATYESGDALLEDKNVEAVIIALPTYLHKEYILKSIKARKHILCEKPMVLNASEGREVAAALERYDRAFMVAHCIRFWPAYAKAYEIIRDGIYGKARYARFVRNGGKPIWSWQNWLLDERRSGGALLDLHIHDVDYVSYVFGRPDHIVAAGVREGNEGIGQVTAVYTYRNGPVVTLDGGWAYHRTYSFRMQFQILLEGATLEFSGDVLHVHTAAGEHLTPELMPGDGYTCEQEYFFQCVQQGESPTQATAAASLQSIALVETERAAIG